MIFNVFFLFFLLMDLRVKISLNFLQTCHLNRCSISTCFIGFCYCFPLSAANLHSYTLQRKNKANKQKKKVIYRSRSVRKAKKSVPLVLSTARGRRPQAHLFAIRTSRPVNNICLFNRTRNYLDPVRARAMETY